MPSTSGKGSKRPHENEIDTASGSSEEGDAKTGKYDNSEGGKDVVSKDVEDIDVSDLNLISSENTGESRAQAEEKMEVRSVIHKLKIIMMSLTHWVMSLIGRLIR